MKTATPPGWVRGSRMRTGSSIIKYLAIACLLTACKFDTKSTGPGTSQNPQSGDGSVAGADGQAGNGGAAAVSGGDGAGTGGDNGQAGQSGGEPPPRVADGADCESDDRCESGHCNGGICCAMGYDCCKRPADCSTDGSDRGKACDDRENCNGTAGKVTCDSQFRCITIDGAPNDSACDATVEANDCGPYKSVYCNGAEVQDIAPECPTSCTSDDDCDPDAHCDGECLPDQPTGNKCDEPSDCASSVCGMNGFCCGMGQKEDADCCSTATDCPAKYSWAPRCDDEATCQGTAGEATCNQGLCGTQMIMDDSACEGRTECGMYAAVVCEKGRREQPNRGCQTSCRADGNCNGEVAFCENSRCVERRDDGRPCDRDAQCKTGCGTNNICCDGRICCASVADCPPGEGTCTESCANGRRKVVDCAANTCIERNNTVEDDSACDGMSFGCGEYKDITCNAESMQQGCPTMCESPADCDEGRVCAGTAESGTCQVNLAGPEAFGGSGGMGGDGG